MKAEIVIYKIISFVLLPVAAIFGIVCLLSILTAISNPTMLISVFLNACMVIYVITSFIFLTKGIDGGRQCKPVLRDWIRINAFITFAFYLLAAIAFSAIKFNKSFLNDALQQMEAQGSIPPGITAGELQQMAGTFVNFLLVLSILLVIHILITFHLMNKYRNLFEPERMDIEE